MEEEKNPVPVSEEQKGVGENHVLSSSERTGVTGEEESSSQNQGSTSMTRNTSTQGLGSENTEGPLSVEEWEERYNKLRAVALKYKKKIAEQKSEIEKTKEKYMSQNASKIMREYDKAMDEVERLSQAEKTLQKDLKKAVEDNVQLKMKDADMTAQIQSLTASHKVLREKLEKNEAESVEELKTKLESAEKELQGMREATSESQQDKRLLQILTLEVSDYEKKSQELKGQLEGRKVECEKLQEELKQSDRKIKELEDTVSHYKEVENQLILARDGLKADLSRKTEKITFVQEEISKLNEGLNERKAELDSLNKELELAKTNSAAQCKELNDRFLSSNKTIAHLEQKVSTLEENKRSRETYISNLKLEMQQLDADFHNYKAKAQAMLKSHKPTSLMDNDETEKMQKSIQEFQSEVSILKSDLQNTKLENENLSLERGELNVRLNQLRTESIQKEVQLNAELQSLKEGMREKENNYIIALENKSREVEQAGLSLQVEIDRLREQYEQQIQQLREQYEMLKSSKDDLTSGKLTETLELEAQSQNPQMMLRSSFRPVGGSPPPSETAGTLEQYNDRISQPLTIDTSMPTGIGLEHFGMMSRGEGEGSESVASIPVFTPRRDSYNLTFEELLSTSLDSIVKANDMELAEHDRRVRESLQKELLRCQNQIAHVTALLRESESNCDRLVQLSEALKEEIRRIERDKERQAHLKENTEYLKNVLLKFVTLSGDDERQRLIPVLKTMLRLTPDEVEKLETVVKGHHSKQGPQTGWSSYLPLWSGGGTG